MVGVLLKTTKPTDQFFETTRGRILQLLRGTGLTVNELMAELELTDNAVRAHLAALEKDGLVKQAGIQPGVRKPHFTYRLTARGEELFPKAYDLLLNQLVQVLKQRLPPKEVEAILETVGSSLAEQQGATSKREQANTNTRSLQARVKRAVEVLGALGGAATIEKESGTLTIRGKACPLAVTVVEHPEACQLARALVAQIVGAPVIERCDREGTPSCAFEINE
jgi:predicted ArsR family transcriptional regulator